MYTLVVMKLRKHETEASWLLLQIRHFVVTGH